MGKTGDSSLAHWAIPAADLLFIVIASSNITDLEDKIAIFTFLSF